MSGVWLRRRQRHSFVAAGLGESTALYAVGPGLHPRNPVPLQHYGLGWSCPAAPCLLKMRRVRQGRSQEGRNLALKMTLLSACGHEAELGQDQSTLKLLVPWGRVILLDPAELACRNSDSICGQPFPSCPELTEGRILPQRREKQ